MNEKRNDLTRGVGMGPPATRLQDLERRLAEAQATIQSLLSDQTTEREVHDALRVRFDTQGTRLKQALQDLDDTVDQLHSTMEELETQNQEMKAAYGVVDEERKRYRDLFELAPEGYLVTDKGGIIEEANLAAAGLLDVPQPDLLRQPMSAFLAPGQQTAFRFCLQRLIRGGKVSAWETWLRSSAAGLVPVLVDAVPITVEEPHQGPLAPHLRWTLHDLRERKQAEVDREDLAGQLQGRTQELERRTMELQVASDVGKAASLHLTLDEFLSQAAQIIHAAFDAYSVGILLLDRLGNYAVLRAASGEPGQHMLEAGHKIEIENDSLAGWSIAHAEVRLSQGGDDAETLWMPGFPHSRSRVSVPIMSRDECLGALLVQSMQENRFTDADVPILETMADQLGTAIENARLYQEARESAAHRQDPTGREMSRD